MRLGPFEIAHPFILAPMAGITHSPFRRIMRRHGASLVVSELIAANGIAYMGEKTLGLLKFSAEERPLGLQIFGEDGDRMADAARLVEKMGADFVDLNLACPVPKVVRKGGGAAMCRDVPRLAKVLEGVVRAVKIPVTIKIRTGWDADSRNALEVVRAAGDSGVAWVAVHGRTRAQGYSGEADWEFLGDLTAHAGAIPIIGNGDLVTPELAVERYRKYGVDAVMIGRGVLRNPFFFEQAARVFAGESYVKPGPLEYVEVLKELAPLFDEHFGEQGSLIHMRKFLAWFSSGFPGCHEFRSKVFSQIDRQTLWAEALHFFSTIPVGRDLGHLQEKFLMGGEG
ncbi:tRNA dihydrouridine synthase DusB [Bdellovibrionota bacterium FG-2]